MGRTSLSAFVAACPEIDTVKVKGRGAKNRDIFVDWVRETYPQIKEISCVETDEELVRGCDVVGFCSSASVGDPSTYPRVYREWLDPGTFVAMPGVGAVDDDIVASDVHMVLDHTGLYEAWADELPSPAHPINPVVGMQFMDLIAEGRLTLDDLGDLGQVVAGEAPGRQNDEEIFILSVGGLPIEDVAWATVVYRNAIEQGIGVTLNLWDEPILR